MLVSVHRSKLAAKIDSNFGASQTEAAASCSEGLAAASCCLVKLVSGRFACFKSECSTLGSFKAFATLVARRQGLFEPGIINFAVATSPSTDPASRMAPSSATSSAARLHSLVLEDWQKFDFSFELA